MVPGRKRQSKYFSKHKIRLMIAMYSSCYNQFGYCARWILKELSSLVTHPEAVEKMMNMLNSHNLLCFLLVETGWSFFLSPHCCLIKRTRITPKKAILPMKTPQCIIILFLFYHTLNMKLYQHYIPIKNTY